MTIGQDKKLGQVGAAVREIFETIEKIEAVLETLENQLNPILNSPRVEEDRPEDVEKEMVPLASDLRKGYRSLQSIFARLSKVSDRIEL